MTGWQGSVIPASNSWNRQLSVRWDRTMCRTAAVLLQMYLLLMYELSTVYCLTSKYLLTEARTTACALMILPSADRVMSSRNSLSSNPESRAITSWLWSLHWRNITRCGEGWWGVAGRVCVCTLQVSVGNCLEFVKYHQTESVDWLQSAVVPNLPWEFGRTNHNMRKIIILPTHNSRSCGVSYRIMYSYFCRY